MCDGVKRNRLKAGKPEGTLALDYEIPDNFKSQKSGCYTGNNATQLVTFSTI